MGKHKVQFSVATDVQHDEMEVYAQIKGFKDVSTLALYAAISLMSRVGYTESQKAKAEELLAERRAMREASGKSSDREGVTLISGQPGKTGTD